MTAIVILAAGSSNRLGEPKQNLIFQSKTLLQRAIDTALDTICRPILVVLGGNEQLISVEKSQDIKIIYNPDWHEGMASSIRMGIKAIETDPSIADAIIMLCDQPFVSTTLIGSMIQSRQQTNKIIVACQYNNTLGVPVLFNRILFDKLLLLKGDEGAKKIIVNHLQDVAEIPFEQGDVDIDTIEDFERLLKSPIV